MNIIKKKLLLGITGSIAAYKIPYLVREMVDKGYEVQVVLTESAKAFVTPLTLQTVSGHSVRDALLDPDAEFAMGHIELARWADLILIAPASANFIAKLTYGFADDLLSTLCLVATQPIWLAPAMNQQMWLNSATQENVMKLQVRGHRFLGPAAGIQACGEDGPGRMLEPADIAKEIFNSSEESFLNGKRVLITAGPTHEPIDPVRFITNRSSGKMGYALAEAAIIAGAHVTLITGPTSLHPPFVTKLIKVKTADEMQLAVHAEIIRQDIFISAAAVSDYKFPNPEKQKIKREAEPLSLLLEPTIDILQSISKIKPKPFIVGFAAETENILENARKKLHKKGCDLIIVNDVSRMDIGFESDDNAVTVLSEESAISIEKMPKKRLAQELLKIIYEKSLLSNHCQTGMV